MQCENGGLKLYLNCGLKLYLNCGLKLYLHGVKSSKKSKYRM